MRDHKEIEVKKLITKCLLEIYNLMGEDMREYVRPIEMNDIKNSKE